MQVRRPDPLCIRLPGFSTAVLLRPQWESMEYVGDLVEAIISRFKKLEGFKTDELQLFKLDGTSRTLLDATQTLSDAGVGAGTTLSVELVVAVRAGT